MGSPSVSMSLIRSGFQREFIFVLSFAVDITTYHNDFHGDVNETVFVGKPDERSIRLVKNAYNCLAKAMDAGQ